MKYSMLISSCFRNDGEIRNTNLQYLRKLDNFTDFEMLL